MVITVPQFSKRIIVELVAISLVVFSLSTLMGYALDVSLENKFVGTPIAETHFADLSSPEPSRAMYPGAPVQTTEGSISMEIVYNESDMMNLTDAVSSALLFMDQSEYIKSLNFTLDQGWTRLESARWTLRFNSSSTDVYVAVNAITGAVTSFSIRWYGPSPYVRDVDSSILSIHDIELAAVQFFEENNLTLSSNSHYITATLENDISYLTHNVYVVRFFEVVNNALVDGNVVAIYLDVLTGDVVKFSYQWIFIDEIPTSGIIDKAEGNNNAIAYMNQESDERFYRISYTVLLFKDFGSYKSPSYHLCWAVYTDHSRFAVIYVNAKNGVIISAEEYAIASSYFDNTRLDFVSLVLPFVLSLSGAILAYSIANHYTRISPIRHNSFPQNE
jgi:hypothetical protein